MRHLRSVWLALVLAALPFVSHAVTPIGGPTAVLINIADFSTAIPGGTGNFTGFIPQDSAFPPDPCISAGNVAFWGAGVSGQQGIYALRFGVLGKVADKLTNVPGGTGTFVAFPDAACPAGVFAGFVSNPLTPPGPPNKIAGLNTPAPGSTGNFTAFGGAVTSGTTVAFNGTSAGQAMSNDAGTLGNYNSGGLTPGCLP